MMVDTDVIIWASRGNTRAANALNNAKGLTLSAVTYMEVVQGVRSKQELRDFQKALRIWRATVVHVNEPISQQAMFLVERYGLSHSLYLADALVAATAVHDGSPLFTGHAKHYGVVPDLDVLTFSP